MDNYDKEFYELLKKEVRTEGLSLCEPSDELISLVLSRCELLKLPKNCRVVDEGDIDNSLYILRTGIMRVSYYENEREVTLGIAAAPTLSVSPLGFVLKNKAHYMVTTCTPAEVYRLDKDSFDSLMMESHEFSRWMFSVAIGQMSMLEYKSQNLVGSTKDKYQSLRNKEYVQKLHGFSDVNVPDIAREVNDRVIASFLGVHPAYLSTIKRELIEDERKGK